MAIHRFCSTCNTEDPVIRAEFHCDVCDLIVKDDLPSDWTQATQTGKGDMGPTRTEYLLCPEHSAKAFAKV